MEELRLLVLADIHYIHQAIHVCSSPQRKCCMGLRFLEKAIHAEQGRVDGILLLGDLVDNGNAERGCRDLEDIRDAAAQMGVPVLAVAGNHDGPVSVMERLFPGSRGIHRIKGYQILVFWDTYTEGDRCHRDMDGMEALFREADPGIPTLVFQHNPVHPAVESDYPYNILSARCIMDTYSRHGVVLSVSGHFHNGLPMEEQDGVGYATCRALCQTPFCYSILTIKDRTYRMTEYTLGAGNQVRFHDLHVHTKLAYCGAEEMEPGEILNMAAALSLEGLGFSEHLGQLYVSPEDFWSGRFVDHPDLLRRNQGTRLDRVEIYRNLTWGYRGPGVLVGVETEVDRDGRLCILERDEGSWDFLLGAVHFLPDRYRNRQREGYLWACQQLLDGGIHILAHPFRIFSKGAQPPPTCLYRPVARMLKESGTAAELNFHVNRPDPAFFRICLEEGVRIALGSDAHILREVGCSRFYLEFLKGICEGVDPQNILYQPQKES